MDINKYIESGILELYVLGQLSPKEMEEVASMQAEHQDIAQEIYKISMAMEQIGLAYAVPVPPHVWDKIADQTSFPPSDVPPANTKPNTSSFSFWVLGLSLIAVAGWILYFSENKNLKSSKDQYDQLKSECDSLQNKSALEYAMLKNIVNPENEVVKLAYTPNYPDISLYLHHNKDKSLNVIQILKAPVIDSSQVFQLWALKDGSAPMPLNTFATNLEYVNVDYVEDVTLYAITIEATGGSQTPTMDRLIGTMQIGTE